MSDLDQRPVERVSSSAATDGPEELLLTARKVYLGKTTEVARALPDRELRMIGAWCFLDHYGPEDIRSTPGMQVWAHPHTGLQTVSWLLDGEIEHRDSIGSVARVRPHELHIMTSGRGIVHSELSRPDKPPMLHGVQLWVALPDDARGIEPRFESLRDLPRLDRPGVRGQVLVGEVDGVRSPAITHSPLCGADLTMDGGAELTITLDPAYEYGLFVVEGTVAVGGTTAAVDQLLYLGTGRPELAIRSAAGARVILLGGRPFEEDIVMWWNFIGRSHREIVGYRDAWVARTEQFPAVVDRAERVMEAPPLPTTTLKARPRRRVL